MVRGPKPPRGWAARGMLGQLQQMRAAIRGGGGIAMSIAEFQRAFADLTTSPERCVALRDGRTEVLSVLPHSCRLLGDRLMGALDTFWSASRHATLQYSWESWRFGLWLEERIAARQLPGGPVEDAIRLELAIFDVQAAARGNGRNRWRIVLLRYDPDELFDPAIAAEDLQPIASGVTVLVDATSDQLAIRRIDDRLEGMVA
jgi:hypothetical protein